MPRDPSKYGTAVCPVCGKEFEYILSGLPRRCCSRSCAAKARYEDGRWKRPQVDPSKHGIATCPTCSKQFDYLLSWPRKYCSNVCAGKSTVTNIKHFTPTGYDTTCEVCGKVFHANNATRGRFCSSKCFGVWQSENIRGEAHPLYGRKVGRHKYLPPPTMMTCQQCGLDYVIKPSHADFSHFCSRKCLAAFQSMAYRGKGNPSWEGGYEPYYGPTWPAARRNVLARDKVCQGCGITTEQNGRELDVHHRKPFRTFGRDHHEQANDPANLVALCQSCHLSWEWAAKGRRGSHAPRNRKRKSPASPA